MDWRQLKRWVISDRLLPADAKVLYRPSTAWEQYSRYIIAIVVVLVLLLTLVAFLLIDANEGRRKNN